MTALLTVLVPNYNRPRELGRLLAGVYGAIDHAAADARVKVVVVDDHSDEDLSAAIEPHQWRHNFSFSLQERKCGNAEAAFLAALDRVETEYVWLLGNDDQVSVDSINYVLRVLDSTGVGLVLLNPSINKASANRGAIPISATTASVAYERAEDLFMDFGFVTSTTTFPCLIMKAAPVRMFHRRHRFVDHATVYSHTFTMFGALRDQPALFLPTPVVSFTLNERLDEQQKLQKQAPDGIACYHQSLGLARLIRTCSDSTGITIARLGSAFEDEVDKDRLGVVPTHLSHFLTFFFIEQLYLEQNNVLSPRQGFSYLGRAEIDEIVSVIQQFRADELWSLCAEALEAYNWQHATAGWKERFLRAAQARVHQLASDKYQEARKHLPAVGPKKVATSSFLMTPLRGRDGGRYGQWVRTRA